MPQTQTAPDAHEPGSRDAYLLGVVSQLVSALENVLGSADAAGFVSIAAQTVAQHLAPQCRLTREEMSSVLVELKRSIGGDFYVSAETPDTIVLGNRKCPFGQHAIGRRTLCMTTSNILGSVTARNLGYARVDLQKTIAEGDSECLVSIHLTVPPTSAAVKGREYFGSVNE